MMKGTVMFASLLVAGESLTCTGSDDPSASVAFFYSGSDLGETADGVASKVTPCLGKSFTKSGAGSHGGLERLRERRADQFPSSTVRTKMRSTPQWSSPSFAWRFRSSGSSCSSVGATTCTGSGDPPSAAPFCYTGSKLGETVNLKVNTFASEAGSFDLMGNGLESISCLGKSFMKSGQSLVSDLSDCVSLATISKLEYGSDQDQIVAIIKDGFISTDAVLSNVADFFLRRLLRVPVRQPST